MKKTVYSVRAVILIVFVSTLCFGWGCVPPSPTYSHELLAKAEVDECFNGIGQPYVPGPNCGEGEKPKANQSYLWALTKVDDTVWIGTGANMLCLMRAGVAWYSDLNVNPMESDLWTCEYEEGQYLYYNDAINAPSNVFSDYRAPKIYTYNLNTRTLTDKTLEIADPQVHAILNDSFGLRSAAAFQNLVFLAGPSGMFDGVNMLVFNAVTGELVGARKLTQYKNVRRWTTLNNVLYTTVTDVGGGGKVLRWTGSMTDPFSFEEIGVLDAKGAEIAAHNGRLFVGTWPEEIGTVAGLWMSPVVPAGGLTAAHADGWQKVWQADAYEPDPVIANFYGMGAMASFDGYLYWGTMHVQGSSFMQFIKEYDVGVLGMTPAFFNVWRTTTIFRGKDFENGGKAELLYGNASLPVFVPNSLGGYWTMRPNKMGGIRGKYGAAGFGNTFNNYTWTMAIYKDELYVGTMDNSYLWLDWTNLVTYGLAGEIYDISWELIPDPVEYGGDLWRFPAADKAGVKMTQDGFANFTNYGFRTVVSDDTGLYLGTANPANIAQDDDGNLIGGWELIRVKKQQ